MSPDHRLSREVQDLLPEWLVETTGRRTREGCGCTLRVVETGANIPEARICLGLAYALTTTFTRRIDHLETAGR